MSDPAELKRQAALAAVAEVRDGMKLGLGTGSTAAFAIRAIGERLRQGELHGIVGMSTSRRTTELAREYGIPLVPLAALSELDLAIDGADEVDPRGDLLKGGGGALLLEKAVEKRAHRLVIIVDGSKLVDKLGAQFALPVEVAPGAWREESAALASLGCTPAVRRQGEAMFLTDSGNPIVDCRFPGGIDDPHALARLLDARPNVRAHGLFLDMATEVIVAEATGLRRMQVRPERGAPRRTN